MTTQEFHEKWLSHLEQDHYGLAIDNDEVTKFVDECFEKIKVKHPNFTYSQIKLKFGMARVYIEPALDDAIEIERGINQILHNSTVRKN